MRKSIAIIATAFTLLASAMPAFAATAYLVGGSCHSATSPTGSMIYVGTYQYAGSYFSQSFSSFCPMTIEIR